MICQKCGHNHKHDFVTPVSLSFCGAALATTPVSRCLCMNSEYGVEVKTRNEGEVIPEDFSLTETPIAFYLRNRYKNSKNKSVIETLRYSKNQWDSNYDIKVEADVSITI